MKILIAGCGTVGSVVCKLLSQEKSIKSIICADINIQSFGKNAKVHFKHADFSNRKQILRLLKNEGYDLIVNTSLPVYNKILLKCCLENKVNYIDLASYWDFDRSPKAKCPYKVEQLDFNDKFKKKNLVGLINAGISPGLTNLLARKCADTLEEVEFIRIRLFEDTQTEELCFPWSIEWLLDKINCKPLVYRNGKFRIMENYSEEEVYNFPQPLGERKVCLISQEEVGTIPQFIKVKNVDIKSYDNQIEINKLLVNMGLVSKRKIKIGKNKIAPLQFLSELLKEKNKEKANKLKIPDDAQFGLVVEADGKKDNKNVTIRFSVIFPKQKEINRLKLDSNFISYPTALLVKLFVLSIPKINKYGVYPPELLEEDIRKSILKELKKYFVIKNF